jgi:hypothetical protein
MSAGVVPAASSAYQRGWRRMLVDMEIPAWDERFLSRYDPVALADLYVRAHAASVMFSCKNLSGLCLWPAGVGEMHPGLTGRDVVGETLEALRERDIAPCAYFAVIFDNWAHDHDPDWRFEPLHEPFGRGTTADRHAHCCPNSPGYRAYVEAQISDLYGRYDFGAAFCDMTFWPGVCGCRHCRERFRAEAGSEIPAVIDWTSPGWCAFQAARERWIDEFTELVTDAMRRASPGIAVYHNFAPGQMSWRTTVPVSVTEHSDFLGGDFYGDAVEQLVVAKLMGDLARSRPVECMTFATLGFDEHVTLKAPEQLRSAALGAVAESAAMTFIEAIDPVGTANAGAYDLIGSVFAEVAALEDHLGGEPVEDVALYFSNESKVDFGENGTPLRECRGDRGYPHLLALRGAARALQRAQVPFGIVTRRRLAELDRYPVLVLPGVARMDAEEVEAIRGYVERGGRLYASRYASLVETRGVRHADLLLADVLGVRLGGEEPSGVVYGRPAAPLVAEAIAPQRHFGHAPRLGALAGGLLRVAAAPGANVLATLTLPYAHPHPGEAGDRRWASIHSFPPWEDTGTPLVVEHRFGAGRAVYSAVELERDGAHANERLFAALVQHLLGERWSVRCEASPEVRLSAFRHDGGRRLRVVLLNSPPALVPEATLRLRPPAGGRFTALAALPSGEPVPFQTEADGTLRCAVGPLPEITMLVADVAAPDHGR